MAWACVALIDIVESECEMGSLDEIAELRHPMAEAIGLRRQLCLELGRELFGVEFAVLLQLELAESCMVVPIVFVPLSRVACNV